MELKTEEAMGPVDLAQMRMLVSCWTILDQDGSLLIPGTGHSQSHMID